MKVLVLGGGRFLGRAIVATAVARGHDVTVFNRGRRPLRGVTPLETIVGDRSRDLGRLSERRFDVVVDTCGYLPDMVRESVRVFESKADRYVFISTLSVFGREHSKLEETLVATSLPEEQLRRASAIDGSADLSSSTYGELYGPLKALCESVVVEAFRERSVILRPGLLVGPGDYTDRFTYWPHRIREGGEVLAPGRRERQVQFVDVRDLAEWILVIGRAQTGGIFHVNGPSETLTMEAFMDACRRALNRKASLSWVGDAFLDGRVAPFQEMPLWIPDSLPWFSRMMTLDCHRAVAAGLRFRPIEATLVETLAWFDAEAATTSLRAGLSRDAEQRLLRQWWSETRGHG